jgi:hypothetical protein
MPTAIKDSEEISSSDPTKAEIVADLMKFDRDVFVVAILDSAGNLEAFSSKPFFSEAHRKDSDSWLKAARRNAALVSLANQDETGSDQMTGIVFFRRDYKQILISVPSKKIIVEAIMPLWNHSTVFFDSVHKYFGD